MAAVERKLDARGWGLLVALAVLWSASFVFIKVSVAEMPILTLVLVRVALAAAVLHVVVIARRLAYPARPRVLASYAVMGVVNNLLPFALIAFATIRLGAGSASILNATPPIFAILIAHVATVDEKITRAKLAGVVLGLLGVAVMSGLDALAGLGGDVFAVLAMLVASFFYGLSAIYGRRFAGIDPTVSAACQLTASTLLLAPVAIVVDRPWAIAAPGALAIASAVALALFSTALAYVIYYALIARAGATNTVLVTLLIPIGAVGLGWALLGEAFTAGEVAGMLMIGGGLLVIDGRVPRKLTARARTLEA
jgi:drug/metabolite transporter (DMT)-like permease